MLIHGLIIGARPSVFGVGADVRPCFKGQRTEMGEKVCVLVSMAADGVQLCRD